MYSRPPSVRDPLLIAIWVAAIAGFINKVAVHHRVNSIGTWSYLLLGWLPAIPLVGNVPSPLGMEHDGWWSRLLGRNPVSDQLIPRFAIFMPYGICSCCLPLRVTSLEFCFTLC